MRAPLVLFVLSTAAGYRLSIPGIQIAGRSPPSWVADELDVACWLRNEFNDACSTFRGDVRRRCMAIWFETTGQHNNDWHNEWHRRGQRASFEALVFLPDGEAAVRRELEYEWEAGAQRLHQLDEEERQLLEQGDLRAARETRERWFDLNDALQPSFSELAEYTYASWPRHHDNPAWPTQKLADDLRREDAVYAQRYATFVVLRKQGKHHAASEIWEELRMCCIRRGALSDHLNQVVGNREGISRSKDDEAGLPPGTTARLERCLEPKACPLREAASPFDYWRAFCT